MGLRINTNVAAINAGRTLATSNRNLNRTMQRLSSGLRINGAADDAAGLTIAEGFNSVVRGSQVAMRNAQDGISLVQTAEGALNTVSTSLQRMRELALQASNGTYSETDTEARDAMQAESDALASHIASVATDTEFNGIKIIGADAGAIALQLDVTGDNQLTVTTVQVDNTTLGGTDLTAIDLSTAATAATAVADIDDAIAATSDMRGDLGAVQNRLDFAVDNLRIQEENNAASESAIRDADFARETVAFTRNQILISAGTSVLAQTSIVPQTALQLLG